MWFHLVHQFSLSCYKASGTKDHGKEQPRGAGCSETQHKGSLPLKAESAAARRANIMPMDSPLTRLA